MNKLFALALTLATCLLAGRTSAVGVCAYAQLGSLTSNQNLTLCASDSGVSVLDLAGAPDDDQLTAMCGTESCVYLMEAILELDPDDCTLPRNENLQLMSDLVDPFVEHCTEMGIEIAGGSEVGTTSSSGVEVGDDDSQSLGSTAGSSGSSDAIVSGRSSSVVITGALSAVALLIAAW